MRTTNIPVQPGSTTTTEAVVFDGGHGEVRDYVRGFVVGVSGMVQSRLPAYVRWLVPASLLATLLGAAFDKVWPVGTATPVLGEPGQ